MADEQGTGKPAGNYARRALGQAVNSILAVVGPTGRQYPARESPPSGAEVGDTYLADGTNWDPAGTGNPAFVQYDGTAWTVIVEHT